MCLIVYVPEGKAIPRATFQHAGTENDDGIGVMSAADGVRKFFGRKKLKRARRYSQYLSGKGVAHGVHFRWRTHGDMSADNVHPFAVPQTRAWFMHNGVIQQTAALATADKSDTRLYVESLAGRAPVTVDPATPCEFWGEVESALGWGNRALVMYEDTGVFYILNEKGGEWIDGCWYSNTYSLPRGFYKDTWADYRPVRTRFASNEPTYGGYCSRCWLPMRATGVSCTCDADTPLRLARDHTDVVDDLFLIALELANDDDGHASDLIDAALDAAKGDEPKALEILRDELAARDEAETGDDVPPEVGERDPVTGVWLGSNGERYASRSEMERGDAFLPLDGEFTHDWDN
jgi:hypothetical protein